MPQDAGLSWGSLQFAGEVEPDLAYQIHAVADGANMGNPQPLLEIVKSLLTDGSLAVLQGWDNREIPIRLRLSAGSDNAGPALAKAESALMAEVMVEAKSPLVWIPPAQDAATCVFDVVAAKLERDTSEGWDFDEVSREERFYLLTLTCLPFARTIESTVAEALPVPPGPPVDPDPPVMVLIDDCASATGWSRTTTNSGTGPTVSGSSLRITADINSGANIVRLTRTGAVAMGATPYLNIDVSWLPSLFVGGSTMPTYVWVVRIDGVETPVVGVGNGESGATRLTVVPPASFSTLSVDWDPITIGNCRAVEVKVWRVQRVSIPGDTTSSTTRQQARTVAVSGSAPTQAAIRLWDETPNSLGAEVLIYTSRALDWQPALRQWTESTGGVTADSTMVSGGRQTLTAPTVYLIPAALLSTGSYSLMGRLNVTTGGTLAWQARMVDSAGAATTGSSVVTSGSVALSVTSGYEISNLGSLFLPVVAVESDQMVELTITGTSNMTLDEAWLFSLTDGVLTWVRNPDVEWVEVRSPELGAARPSVYGGTGAVGENGVCIDWACESFGSHRFDPGIMQVFTVTTSSLVSESELEFYPRFHSHVDDVA